MGRKALSVCMKRDAWDRHRFTTTKEVYTLRKDLNGLVCGQIDKNLHELWFCCPCLYRKAWEKMYGEQIVVNEKDEILDFNKRLLIGSTMLSAQEIVDTIHSLGGLSVASHIDKDAFSIISQLGFITEEMGFDALEMSPHISRESAEQSFQMYNAFTWITSSDAHYPHDIGRRTTSFFINEPTTKEMSIAFKQLDGRRVEWR